MKHKGKHQRAIDTDVQASHETMLMVMDSIEALVYVADMDSFEILFLNWYGRELFGDVVGELCWKIFQNGQTGPCSFCTNDRLVDAAGNPAGVYNWEFRNTVTGRWYDIRDRAIKWPGDRLVRLEIATDITEKKITQDEIREREQLFTEAQKVAHIGVYVLDIVSGMWKGSEVLDEIFGIDEGYKRSVEGWAAIVHPDERQEMVDYLASEVLAKKGSFDREYRIMRINDQQERWVYGRGELKFDQSGNTVTMLGAIQDITERKRAEEALVHSHDLMQYIIAHNQSAVAVHDKDMKYIFVSDEYLRQYKVKEKDVLGKHHYDVFPDLPQKWRDVHQRVLAGAVEGQEEDPYVREDGTVDWTRWECRPWYESDGSIGGLIVYTEVITERKNIEVALRESEARLAEAQHISHVGSWDWNPQADTLFWSEENWDIMGIPRDKSPSVELFMEYIHPDDRGLVGKSIAAALEGAPYEVEFRIIRSDGVEINIRALGEVEYDAQGKPSRMFGTLQDVTEMRRMEQLLLQSQKIESLGRLAGGIAHDFNNILTAVQGYTELAMDELPRNSTAYLELEESQKSIERAVNLTKQLLLSSRKGLAQSRPVELGEMVMGMKRLLEKIIGEKYIIRTELEEGLNFTVGDKSNLEQALMNLVINAGDSMNEGGEILIAVSNRHLDKEVSRNNPEAVPGDFICLSVSDSGTGFDDETRARIFDPFFSSREVGQGSGLGLSVVHGVVKQHLGWIDVESEPGKGSVFTLYLPVYEGEVEDGGEIDKTVSGKAGGGNVLLVEDEELVRNLTEKILVRNGYNVHAACDAEEARAIFIKENGGFDLIFCDVVLPGEDGFSMCKDLKRQNPSIGIIMASGYSDTYINPEEIKEKGFIFLHKPYNLDVLLGALEEAVRTSR